MLCHQCIKKLGLTKASWVSYVPCGECDQMKDCYTIKDETTQFLDNAWEAIVIRFPHIDDSEIEEFLGHGDFEDPLDAVRQFESYLKETDQI
jgi:hypothetical protein